MCIRDRLRAINASGTTVVMATHEATFVDIMQQRVIELSQGVVVRDEQAGGYGETASIDLGNLTEACLLYTSRISRSPVSTSGHWTATPRNALHSRDRGILVSHRFEGSALRLYEAVI